MCRGGGGAAVHASDESCRSQHSAARLFTLDSEELLGRQAELVARKTARGYKASSESTLRLLHVASCLVLAVASQFVRSRYRTHTDGVTHFLGLALD